MQVKITECSTPSLIIQRQLYGLQCSKLRHLTPLYLGCDVVGQRGIPRVFVRMLIYLSITTADLL